MAQQSDARFPPWIELPPEITADILQRLGAVEILDSAQKVCTTWWKVSKDPSIWKTIAISCQADDKSSYIQKVKMCHEAVDRSQGQAIAINISHLGLFGYPGRSGQLKRRLYLEFTDKRPFACVIEAVKKLSLLEKLHLDAFYVPADSCCELIETAGNSCPMLKSFTLNKKRTLGYSGLDGVAQAVAKWMPELRHLALVGDMLTDQALEVILDGCVHLESLHLSRSCFLSRLEFESLVGRYSQQITELRLGDDIDVSDDDRL